MPRHLAAASFGADPVAVDRVRRLRPPAGGGAGWVPDRFEDPDDDDPGGRWSHQYSDPDTDTDTDTDGGAGLDRVESPDDAGDDDVEPAVASEAVRAKRIRAGPWRRLAETWVPEPLRDARVDPGRRGALILSLVAAVAAIAAAIGVWRDRPEPRPIQPVASAPLTDRVGLTGDPSIIRTGSSGTGRSTTSSRPAAPLGGADGRTPPGASHSAGAPAAAESVAGPSIIAVSVTGLVRRPGLVRLPAGSRVAAAIEAAGGVADGGSITGLNLAQPLSDGDSVVVGPQPPTPPSGSGPTGGNRQQTTGRGGAGGPPGPAGTAGSAAAAPIDLNTADATALEALPGVGPVMAGNIVAWREANGSFNSVEQLQEVTGIGPTRYAQLAPLVTVG